ncbi:MAG: hypothetical protein ACI81P_001881 [Neolewinella sp.]|jgi:hypothetical protein
MIDRLSVKVNFSATAIDVGELARNEKNIYFTCIPQPVCFTIIFA